MSRRPPRGRSRTATSSSSPSRGSAGPIDLDAWLAAAVATPGLTSLVGLDRAREVLLEDALRALPLVERFGGPVVDVGSGGGSPGIPLAVRLPQREVTLLDAGRRKCDFLRRWAPPNATVVWGRAEEQPLEAWGVALAKALARPPVAAEWCLPLVRRGGAALLWVGESADLEALGRASAQLGGGEPEQHEGIVVLPKVAPTPAGFPRRAGRARKRPLV